MAVSRALVCTRSGTSAEKSFYAEPGRGKT
jgi:hypothetical protein